jgi:hypothetical protein
MEWIFVDVNFYFNEPSELLKMRGFLYEVGLDNGLPNIILNMKNHISNQLNILDKNCKEYKLNLNSLKYLDSKLEEA